MKFKLTYKTSSEHSTFAEEHTIITDSYTHAKAIEHDLKHGDFGDIICYNIIITPELMEEQETDDLPF